MQQVTQSYIMPKSLCMRSRKIDRDSKSFDHAFKCETRSHSNVYSFLAKLSRLSIVDGDVSVT